MEENGIRRVVWIPQKLDHEIENLRQKIGYTRSGFYRYAVTRLMEQMLLSTRKEVKLRPWEEICGTLKGIENDPETITAIIACTQNLDIALPYPKDTPEANTIQNLDKYLGQKIRILKTDNPQQPTIIIKQHEEKRLRKPQVRPKTIYGIDGFAKCGVFFKAMLISLKSVSCSCTFQRK
jgi:hypothetical protein